VGHAEFDKDQHLARKCLAGKDYLRERFESGAQSLGGGFRSARRIGKSRKNRSSAPGRTVG
jgi:hypothetical protein